MSVFDSTKIRNIAIVGHQGSGKTTLVESLLYTSGGIEKKGEVEKKNTVSDYLPDEQRRQCSISTSVVPLYYKDHKINLIDLPGNDDFVTESLGVTRIVKGAVLVVDASTKVQVGTVKAWNMLRKRNIPTFIYINKMDKEDVVFDDILEDIREKLGKNAVPFCYPIEHENKFDGFVNVVDLKARKYDGTKCVDAEIYDDKKMKVFELHNMINEAVAGTDDELLEKFFSGEPLTNEEIHRGLRIGVLNGELIPVLVGCATKNIGIHTMLDMFIDFLPNPSDLKPYLAIDLDGNEVTRKTDSNEPLSAYVFKTIVDPYSGVINLVKINSGTLRSGDEVYVSNGSTQRISNLYVMSGKSLQAVDELGAGDIAALNHLENVQSGMTISDNKKPIVFKPVTYPTAVIHKAIEIKNKADENKIGIALSKIQLEDPAVEVKRNTETKQLLIGGLSASHLQFIIEKLENTYKIAVTTEQPKVVYRESIRREGKAVGRYIKQSGGSGFYGVVEMKFEPADESAFTEEIFGGSVPRNYFPAVEKGFFEALKQGQLAGFPVIGVKATLLDGKYHSVDSNEMAFKMAAILAFKEAYKSCNPIILEPIMLIKINVESKYIGSVISDLNSRRARIQSIEELDHGVQELEALVPESEILDYATQLKSLTQASGFFNRSFYSYEEVPNYLKDRVINENKLI